jgi:hypothetical protein
MGNMGGFCKNVGKYGSLSKLWEIWGALDSLASFTSILPQEARTPGV